MAQGEIRIRNRETGETFVGTGPVPKGYDLLGPASARGVQPEPDILAENIRQVGRQTTAFRELAGLGRAASNLAALPNLLPTVGSIGGSFLGPGGVAAGSLLGESANQVLGITEPSLSSFLLAGAAPAVGAGIARGAGALKRAIIPRLPGASPVLHELAGEAIERLPGRISIIPEADLARLRVAFPQLAPQATKDDLFALVNQFNPRVPLPRMQQTAKELLSKEQIAAAGLKLEGTAPTLRAFQHVKALDFQAVRVNLRRIGDKIRETRADGGEEYGVWKKLFGAIMDDLEAAAAQGNSAMPAVQALKAANLAAKREFAAEELAHFMSLKGGGISLRPDLPAMRTGEPQVQVNLRKILTEIEKSDDLRRALGRDEFKELTQDLARIARGVPALPPMSGANVGSSRMLRTTGGLAGMGTAVGGLIGGPGGAAVGGGVGAATGAFGPMVIAKLVMTPRGRALLGRTLQQSGGTLSAEVLAILGTAVGTTETGRDIVGGAIQIGQGTFGGGER